MIRKNTMSVTMPLNEFEDMQEQIKELKKQRLSNYTNYIFPDEEGKEVVMVFDQEKAIKDIAAANTSIKTINVHTRKGLLLNPITVNQKQADETIAYDEPGDNK